MGSERFGRYTVETSSEGKVLFPESGITKGDLIAYYRDVAPVILRYLRERPLVMRRYPSGIEEQGFVQQNAPQYLPDWIQTTTVEKSDGEITHVLCNNTATLVYLANQNMVTPHVWLSRSDRPREPDQVIFDLDPGDAGFDEVRFAAHAVRELLEKDGLVPYVMTTGSDGVHVRAAIHRQIDFDAVRTYARDRAQYLADRHPARLTIEQRKAKREGRIYLDTGRNAYAQTVVSPYGVRARKNAPVAAPITWEELDDPAMSPRRFTISEVRARLDRRGDPMADMWKHGRSLRAAARSSAAG